jgi:centromeric protein E
MNRKSSRSHVVFRIFINKYEEETRKMLMSVLNFVDLAGSEKLNAHESDSELNKNNNNNNKLKKSDKRIKESKNINKSLFFLT